MSKRYTDIRTGLEDTGFRPLFWWVVTAVAVIVLSGPYALGIFSVLKVNPELSAIGADVFLKYLFIVVAVERASAVFVGMSRSQNRVDWSLRINRITEVLQKDSPHPAILRQMYNREHRLIEELVREEVIGEIVISENATYEDLLGYLTSVKHAYEFQRARYNSVTNRYVSRIVFFAGIIMATLGLSLFDDLFITINLASIEQSWSLRMADIMVTGGLLGGGSAGLNSISSKVTDYMNKS